MVRRVISIWSCQDSPLGWLTTNTTNEKVERGIPVPIPVKLCSGGITRAVVQYQLHEISTDKVRGYWDILSQAVHLFIVFKSHFSF